MGALFAGSLITGAVAPLSILVASAAGVSVVPVVAAFLLSCASWLDLGLDCLLDLQVCLYRKQSLLG